jgi:hypothetical protein
MAIDLRSLQVSPIVTAQQQSVYCQLLQLLASDTELRNIHWFSSSLAKTSQLTNMGDFNFLKPINNTKYRS